MDQVPIIDLFAGPGGLGEGFTSLDGGRRFRVGVSVEMEESAHRTLTLRSFVRQCPSDPIPEGYYAYVRGEITRLELEDAYPVRWKQAESETRRAELGVVPPEELRGLIDERLGSVANGGSAVLIGGPPCQAYSLVGRSRMRPGREMEFEADHRHFLYREYLRILADHAPAVFVMENVKGLLSSTHGGELMFGRITDDLRAPGKALRDAQVRHRDVRYRLVALGRPADHGSLREEFVQARDYVVRSELLGLPQARHRVIILGIREDLPAVVTPAPLQAGEDPAATVMGAIGDLPPLRSGLSRGDSPERWLSVVRDAAGGLTEHGGPLQKRLRGLRKSVAVPEQERGAQFIRTGGSWPAFRPDWYVDERIGGVLNHETRGHMDADLDRYLFASVFAEATGRSPKLGEFPSEILPRHRNVSRALEAGLFSDRFRVQVAGRPSTTITSHISRDGHYFIHPDPSQCRSLTVREAARLQTFPDNYFFEGPRTKQYVQVGNAVPPLLASQIAGVVAQVMDQHVAAAD